MCYYTLTVDTNLATEGHTRAIMITDAKDTREATAKFLNTFGPQYYKDVNLVEGIHVPEGFDRLLTEQARKYILKAKSGNGVPFKVYQNMIQVAYD